MPIQRQIGIGERLFRGAQSAMPLLMQYLQQIQRDELEATRIGRGQARDVATAEFRTDVLTGQQADRAATAQYRSNVLGEDVRQFDIEQQPQPVKPLAGEAGVLEWLKANDPKAYEGYIAKKIHIAPPKTAKGKAPETPREAGRKLTTKRLGQTRETGKIDIKTGMISEEKVPFGIPEAVAAGDSLRNYLETGSFGGQQRGQGLGGASSYDEFIQWYNSPDGQQHPRRDLYLQEAKKQFGVQ